MRSCSQRWATGVRAVQESDLIYDWNVVDYEFTRDEAAHPHPIWFDDETLRVVMLPRDALFYGFICFLYFFLLFNLCYDFLMEHMIGMTV